MPQARLKDVLTANPLLWPTFCMGQPSWTPIVRDPCHAPPMSWSTGIGYLGTGVGLANAATVP